MNLIHVTTLENLEDILQNGLKYSVSREVLNYANIEEDRKTFKEGVFYIPMISFFGMTIKEHLEFNQTYGNLGIILKDINKNKMLNPVRYFNQYSILAKRIADFDDTFKNQNPAVVFAALEGSGQGFRMEAIRMYVENIIYSKLFITELSRRNKTTNEYEVVKDNFYFGMEREWRLIPIELYENLKKIRINNSKNDEIDDYGYFNVKEKIEGFIIGTESEKVLIIELFKKNNIYINADQIIVKENYGDSLLT